MSAGVRREQDAERLRVQAGERLMPLILEITVEDSVQAAAEGGRGEVGPRGMNGLVNNAGIAVAGPLEFVTAGGLAAPARGQCDWRRVRDAGLASASARGQGAHRQHGLDRRRSSTPFVAPYAASKYAREGITDALRRELRKWGMWVAIIEPGSVDTPIWDKGRRDAKAQVQALSATARELYGSDMAGVQAAMLSAAARGLAPEKVAEAAFHALTADQPRARYVIGREARGRVLAETLLPRGPSMQ